MRNSMKFFAMPLLLASACTADEDVFTNVPEQIQLKYTDEINDLAAAHQDVTLRRVTMASEFIPVGAITDKTAKELAQVRAPSAHVNLAVSPPLLEHQPAGWWPLDLVKLRDSGGELAKGVMYAVLDVEADVNGVPTRYTALAFRTNKGAIRIADPVLDPDPPSFAQQEENFSATAGGIIETVPDTDGCNNLKYTSGKEMVSRFIQDSWGLDNRSVMEWKYKFGHIVTVDCRPNATNTGCVAAQKTVDYQADVLNSRQCSPWFTSTTTCDGIVDWSQGNSTFSSGNMFNTYYSTMQLAGDNKFDDIYDSDGASANRVGYHFRAIGQARILTTYDFSAAPALPAWALYLVNGAAVAYYATHLIKFVHWVISETKGDENPWHVAQLDGMWNSEAELTCPAMNQPAAPAMPPPP